LLFYCSCASTSRENHGTNLKKVNLNYIQTLKKNNVVFIYLA
jgi:hypothetical protein